MVENLVVSAVATRDGVTVATRAVTMAVSTAAKVDEKRKVDWNGVHKGYHGTI